MDRGGGEEAEWPGEWGPEERVVRAAEEGAVAAGESGVSFERGRRMRDGREEVEEAFAVDGGIRKAFPHCERDVREDSCMRTC